MSENDALKDYEVKETSQFLKFKDGDNIKLRVLTMDPLVTKKTFNPGDEPAVRFNFIVWNWTAEKAQIWGATPGMMNRLSGLHKDEDFPGLNKIDIKVKATGEMLERRYEITPLPTATDMTKAMIAEAAAIKLEEVIKDGIRLSRINDGEEIPEEDDGQSGYEKAKATAAKIKQGEDVVVDVNPEEEIDLSEIPF